MDYMQCSNPAITPNPDDNILSHFSFNAVNNNNSNGGGSNNSGSVTHRFKAFSSPPLSPKNTAWMRASVKRGYEHESSDDFDCQLEECPTSRSSVSGSIATQPDPFERSAKRSRVCGNSDTYNNDNTNKNSSSNINSYNMKSMASSMQHMLPLQHEPLAALGRPPTPTTTTTSNTTTCSAANSSSSLLDDNINLHKSINRMSVPNESSAHFGSFSQSSQDNIAGRGRVSISGDWFFRNESTRRSSHNQYQNHNGFHNPLQSFNHQHQQQSAGQHLPGSPVVLGDARPTFTNYQPNTNISMNPRVVQKNIIPSAEYPDIGSHGISNKNLSSNASSPQQFSNNNSGFTHGLSNPRAQQTLPSFGYFPSGSEPGPIPAISSGASVIPVLSSVAQGVDGSGFSQQQQQHQNQHQSQHQDFMMDDVAMSMELMNKHQYEESGFNGSYNSQNNHSQHDYSENSHLEHHQHLNHNHYEYENEEANKDSKNSFPNLPFQFRMGFRPTCDKCINKVPGHFSHLD